MTFAKTEKRKERREREITKVRKRRDRSSPLITQERQTERERKRILKFDP